MTNNVISNPSLAWALLEACGSFVECVEHVNQGNDEKWELPEDATVNVLIGITFLLGCPDEYGLSANAMSILDTFSSSHCCVASTSSNSGKVSHDRSLMDVHFRTLLPKITSASPPFPWKQTDPSFLAMDALLRACSGSTVGSNFDMVAPFFIRHLSTAAYKRNDTDDKCLKDATTKDELAEEYRIRISLMALLQTILSDESFFSQTLGPRQSETLPTKSTFSAQFTTDVLLSLVLPNLVWSAGGMASALRKLAAATLFSLLSHYHCHHQKQQERNETSVELLPPEMIAHLIPLLHSNLEDTESTTRELCCVCLSLVLEQVSAETFHDTLCPRLLELLDDSHDPVRMAACKTLGEFFTLANATASTSSFNHLGHSSVENITSSLFIQLDDPKKEIRDQVFQVLLVLLDTKCREEDNNEVVAMIERHTRMALKSHRDGSYCRLLLEKVQEYREWETQKSLDV